jgi:PAS domain S-box-containing protein
LEQGSRRDLGYTKQERIGYPPDALLPEENKKLMEGILKETKEKGFVQSLETQLLTKDGRLLDVEMTFTYMGKELDSTIILRDITRRKKAEQFITALNRAAVATATTLTPAAIYFAVQRSWINWAWLVPCFPLII